MKDFKGKVAVVTGAASGIGLALAERFAAEGMKVVLADIEEKALQSAVEKVKATGAEAIAVRTDVSIADEVDDLARKTIDAFGEVHIVCNNAGVIRGGQSWETPIKDYEWVLGVNFWGVIHGIRSFMSILIEQDVEAHVVNTASSSGLNCTPYTAAYCISKHAVVVLSECMYHELVLSGSKIGVSVLLPTAVNTSIGSAERNRPDRFKHDDKRSADIADLITNATNESLAKGIPPAMAADQVLQAIREGRFYILSGGDDLKGLWGVILNRLDDIRELRNPTFPVPEDMKHLLG
ncbi:MAG: SDR family NAD(P)-dependent oxidoreductase [Dehalococcoidia bacterium]|nr:MAG: SDR family NAD(P)-dependent oxidoreductase [Dehalococcoidia bacterium]